MDSNAFLRTGSAWLVILLALLIPEPARAGFFSPFYESDNASSARAGAAFEFGDVNNFHEVTLSADVGRLFDSDHSDKNEPKQ
jgi:hypothetical protein